MEIQNLMERLTNGTGQVEKNQDMGEKIYKLEHSYNKKMK